MAAVVQHKAIETKEDSMNTHRIAASAGSIGFWRGVAGLAALVLVGAVAIILVSRAPVGGTPAAAPAANASAPAAQQRVIACKPCQEELLAAAQARQSNAAALGTPQPSARDRRRGQEGGLLGELVNAPAHPTARSRVIACKPCQEEVLAAQAQLSAPAALGVDTRAAAFEDPPIVLRGMGPR